jgi:FAD/FMN-containing dehydrogenase
MNCHLYFRKGTVYLPTMGKMDEGFYRGVEPVAVVSASNTQEVRQALRATIARGNPVVPILRRSEFPPC